MQCCLERILPQKETRDQSSVSLSRVTAVRDLSSTLASLLPPYPLTPLPLYSLQLSSSFFSVWPASRCFPLFYFPYLFQPTRLLPSSQSLIQMALSALPKVGAGPTVVSRLYSLYSPHNLTLCSLFKASLLMLSRLSPLAFPLTLQNLDRT